MGTKTLGLWAILLITLLGTAGCKKLGPPTDPDLDPDSSEIEDGDEDDDSDVEGDEVDVSEGGQQLDSRYCPADADFDPKNPKLGYHYVDGRRKPCLPAPFGGQKPEVPQDLNLRTRCPADAREIKNYFQGYTLLDGPKKFCVRAPLISHHGGLSGLTDRFRVSVINENSCIGAPTWVKITTPHGKHRTCKIRQSSCMIQLCGLDVPNCRYDSGELAVNLYEGAYIIEFWADKHLRPECDRHNMAVETK